MNPQPGQTVQVRFHNGIFFDGVVEKWTDGKTVLLLSNNDKVVIQKTLRDVLLVKIITSQEQPVANKPDANALLAELEEIKEKPIEQHSLKRLAELKDELNTIERREVFNNMKTFKPNGAREISYGIPSNIQINRSPQHSEQEIAPTHSAINSELQNLFNKKH